MPTLDVAMDASQAITESRRLAKAVGGLTGRIDRMGKEAAQTGRQMTGMTRRSKLLAVALRRVSVAAAAALATRQLVRGINTYQKLENRLRTVSRSQTQVNERWKELVRISKSSFTPLEASVTLFSRLERTIQRLGRNDDALEITETLNNLMRESGALASESAAGLLQLSQALQSGRLQGDEFRSISENMPAILDLLSRSLGKTTGELREMSRQGKLTTDILLDSLAGYEGGASDSLEQTKTLGQAWNNLEISALELGKAIGESGLSKALIGAIELMEDLIKVSTEAVQVINAIFFTPRFNPNAGVEGGGRSRQFPVLAGPSALPVAEDKAAELSKAEKQAIRNAERFGQAMAGAILDPLRDALFNGDFENLMEEFAKSMLQTLTEELVFKPAEAAISAGVAGLFGGLFDKGAAFGGGNVIPFANGGVVSQPTSFAMSGGRTGLMGERRPEAIMPLEKTSDGDLGVKMVGGGGGIVIHQTFNVRNEDHLRRTVRQVNEENRRMRGTG